MEADDTGLATRVVYTAGVWLREQVTGVGRIGIIGGRGRARGTELGVDEGQRDTRHGELKQPSGGNGLLRCGEK